LRDVSGSHDSDLLQFDVAEGLQEMNEEELAVIRFSRIQASSLANFTSLNSLTRTDARPRMGKCMR